MKKLNAQILNYLLNFVRLLKGFDFGDVTDNNTIRYFMNTFMNRQFDGLDLGRCAPCNRFGKRLYLAAFKRILPSFQRCETSLDV